LSRRPAWSAWSASIDEALLPPSQQREREQRDRPFDKPGMPP
jgi:hypothetical protein